MRIQCFVFLTLLSFTATGCGPGPTVMPTGQFTEEQKIAAAAEYQKVEDEESMGNNKKFKTTKR